MKSSFRIVNIAPVLAGHEDETIADLKRLHAECGVTDVAFMMPLHPELKPLEAKVEFLCSAFSGLKRALSGTGLRIGILIQSTISHGHGALSDAGFQKIVTSDGNEANRNCPLDRGFREYIAWAVKRVCQEVPAFLIVDDDFRLAFGKPGCFCPLHLAEFNRRVSGSYTRESLLEVLNKTDAESCRLGAIWDEVLMGSLVDLSKLIRKSIDAVAPETPCGPCTYIGEFKYARPTALALAGKNRPFVRVNDAWYLENSWYSPLGYKFVPRRLHHTAMQVATLQGMDILAEVDTFYHSQHSLSARSMNGEIVASLLNGVNGVKLWITTLNEYEPESGVAYRETLKANHGLYSELARILPGVKWHGPSTPLPSEPLSNWNPVVFDRQARLGNWAGDVCGRFGIPSCFGEPEDGVFMLSGNEVDSFSEAELLRFCGKGLLLDGAAAERMCQRGFGKHIGVAVVPGEVSPSGERFNDNPVNGDCAGKIARVGNSFWRLNSLDKRVQVVSEIFRTPWYMSPEEDVLGPGLTLFENDLGGRVAVYAISDFSVFMLNASRKVQLCNLLGWLNRKPLTVVAEGEIDIYARHGMVQEAHGGGELLCVFNLNMDSLPELRLKMADLKLSKVSRLDGEGKWRPQKWRVGNRNGIVVETQLETMIPLILKLER